MKEPANRGRWSTPQKVLLGVVLVLLITTFLTGIAVYVFLRGRATHSIRRASQGRTEVAATTPDAAPSAPGPAPFARLSDANIPGRYKHIEGTKESFIVFYGDHTFMNRDGTTYAQYRWKLGPDSLDITWQNTTTRFTNFEGPGIFSYARTDGAVRRLEKQPASSLTNMSLTATGVDRLRPLR